MEVLKVGDTVMWRGSWGSEPAKRAKIVRMELCKVERDKYGVEVSSAWLQDKNRLCVDLDNGSWAYGFQIEPIGSAA